MSALRNTILIILSVAVLLYSVFWLLSLKKYPVDFGISFNREHATYLGLDWQEVYLKMLSELRPKYVRIDAAWDYVEKINGSFDSSQVDWQMAQAEKFGAKIVLAIGQKTPRWPECRIPNWANQLSAVSYRQKVNEYISYVVERYKNHPALEIWQIENEPFIKFTFGECKNFDLSLVPEEISLVKSLDKNHKILVTDSGELSTWREAARAGDIFGTTVYRVVMTPKGKYWSYNWLPAGFYKFKAWAVGLKQNDFIVSELQAEPWFSNPDPQKISLVEQEKSLNLEKLTKNINFTQRLGVSRAYLWGVEWWYWMKTKQNDSSYWNLVKELSKS